MSAQPPQIQPALNFLALLRDDASLRDRLASTRPTLRVADLVSLGAQHGLVFDEAALRKAFVYDWQMRMAHWQLRTQLPLPPERQTGTAA